MMRYNPECCNLYMLLLLMPLPPIPLHRPLSHTAMA